LRCAISVCTGGIPFRRESYRGFTPAQTCGSQIQFSNVVPPVDGIRSPSARPSPHQYSSPVILTSRHPTSINGSRALLSWPWWARSTLRPIQRPRAFGAGVRLDPPRLLRFDSCLLLCLCCVAEHFLVVCKIIRMSWRSDPWRLVYRVIRSLPCRTTEECLENASFLPFFLLESIRPE